MNRLEVFFYSLCLLAAVVIARGPDGFLWLVGG
jgi:hypothetical protein